MIVTGLDKSAFTIRENGYTRPCLDLANPESDITIVVLTEAAVEGFDTVQTLDEARKLLTSSTSLRKVLIIATQASTPPDLGRVLVLYRSNSETAIEAVETIRKQYVLFFDSVSASGVVDITVQPPRGFPPLKAIR
jgi:hypothetical protein